MPLVSFSTNEVSESAIADETADRFSKFPPEAAQYDDSTALTGDGTDESESPKENTFVESLMKGIREMLAENAQEGNKGDTVKGLKISEHNFYGILL